MVPALSDQFHQECCLRFVVWQFVGADLRSYAVDWDLFMVIAFLYNKKVYN